MKPQLIYIVGAGNSGSTILSMLLGAHSEIVSVGELSQLDRYISLDKECSCGLPVSKCDFWSEVLHEEWLPAPVKPLYNSVKLLTRGGAAVIADKSYTHIINRNLNIYKRILKLTNSSVVIDSSKDLVRLYYLFRSGQFRILPLYMTRDGRAYIYSMKKRLSMSPLRSTTRWARMNQETIMILKKLRAWNDTIHMEYNSFTNNPEESIRKICTTMNLEYDDQVFDFYTRRHHNIAGTNKRFSPERISPQNRWKKELSSMDIAIFKMLGGNILNKRYGVLSK